MKLLRVDSEDLKLVAKDSGGPIVRIDACGWMEHDDMVNLMEFLAYALQRRADLNGERHAD